MFSRTIPHSAECVPSSGDRLFGDCFSEYPTNNLGPGHRGATGSSSGIIDERRMTKTPSSLLERLRLPGDPAAWARFVALYAPLIYGWGLRAGLQESDAADLAQEVLVTLLQVLPTFTY